jgi:outer membrane biosynthesis protein TonB
MKTAKLCAILFCCALLYSISSPNAKADEWNKKTIVTFSGPVMVGKTHLDAGTYVFKLADSPSDRHIVQIFNADESHVIATILAIPDWRLTPTGDTTIKFSETSDGDTQSGTLPADGVAMKEWFYPGDNFGQEFKVVPQPVVAEVTEPAPAPEPAPEPEVAPAPEQPAPEAEAAPEEPAPQAQEPAQTEQPAPAPAPAETPAMPQTASSMPLIALISVLSLAVGTSLRAVAKRRA